MGAPSILTVPEAAALLRVSVDVVYRLLSDRTLPGVRVGRSWRIPEESLSQWLAAQSQPAASAAPSESTTAAASGGPRYPAPVAVASGSGSPTPRATKPTAQPRSGTPRGSSIRALLKLA